MKSLSQIAIAATILVKCALSSDQNLHHGIETDYSGSGDPYCDHDESDLEHVELKIESEFDEQDRLAVDAAVRFLQAELPECDYKSGSGTDLFIHPQWNTWWFDLSMESEQCGPFNCHMHVCPQCAQNYPDEVIVSPRGCDIKQGPLAVNGLLAVGN